MSYNYTLIENSTNILDFFVKINESVNFFPFIIFLLLLFIAMMIYTSNRAFNIHDSFMASSFLVTIISALGFLAGLSNYTVVAFSIVLLIASIIIRMSN